MRGVCGKGGAHREGGAHGQGAHAAGRGRVGGGGRARPSGAYVHAPNGGCGPRHVGGVGAYMGAVGANAGRARLQGGAYICFALLN
jgi:hypothetical protein